MLDFSAYIAAQHLTQDAVNQSLPNAPLRPEHAPTAHRTGAAAARQWLGLALHHLADSILSAHSIPSAPLPASR